MQGEQNRILVEKSKGCIEEKNNKTPVKEYVDQKRLLVRMKVCTILKISSLSALESSGLPDNSMSRFIG